MKWVNLSTERIENFCCCSIQEYSFSIFKNKNKKKTNCLLLKYKVNNWWIFVSSIQGSEYWESYKLLLLGILSVVKFGQLVCKTSYWDQKKAFSGLRVWISLLPEATSCTLCKCSCYVAKFMCGTILLLKNVRLKSKEQYQ